MWTALFLSTLFIRGGLNLVVHSWGTPVGVGSIENVFFSERCVAKFQLDHSFSSQIISYWKAHMFSISENIWGFS
jgi:hypothetical protein